LPENGRVVVPVAPGVVDLRGSADPCNSSSAEGDGSRRLRSPCTASRIRAPKPGERSRREDRLFPKRRAIAGRRRWERARRVKPRVIRRGQRQRLDREKSGPEKPVSAKAPAFSSEEAGTEGSRRNSRPAPIAAGRVRDDGAQTASRGNILRGFVRRRTSKASPARIASARASDRELPGLRNGKETRLLQAGKKARRYGDHHCQRENARTDSAELFPRSPRP
jgi:hypothetical protein